MDIVVNAELTNTKGTNEKSTSQQWNHISEHSLIFINWNGYNTE